MYNKKLEEDLNESYSIYARTKNEDSSSHRESHDKALPPAVTTASGQTSSQISQHSKDIYICLLGHNTAIAYSTSTCLTFDPVRFYGNKATMSTGSQQGDYKTAKQIVLLFSQ